MIYKNPITLITIITLIVVLFSFGIFAFVNLGKWLVVSDPLPERLDVIFAFGGKSRPEYAGDLLKTYQNSILVFSNRKPRKIFNILTNKGLDTNKMFGVSVRTGTFLNIDTTKRSGTYLEVEFLTKWLRESIKAGKYLRPDLPNQQITDSTSPPNPIINEFPINLKGDDVINIGLVSDGYHMRRIKFLAERKKKKLKCRFYYLPVPVEEKIYKYWYENKKLRKCIIFEIMKIIYSYF